VAVIGCGDVARRRYLPALAAAKDVELVACCDARLAAAEAVVNDARGWAPGARAFSDLALMLSDVRPDAAFNLVPATLHAEISQACLDAGVHVYSEKPIASTLDEANRLIATADANAVLLLCAPGTAATRRFQWVREVADSGRFGRATLVVGQYVDPGPAAWREYTGDPAIFYGPGVGPVLDHGIYRLHAMTAVMGPVARVQAMGAIARPERVVRAGSRAGERVQVTSPDHVLMNLEFASGALGTLLSSSAGAASLAPWLEFHFERATLSFDGDQYDKDSPASLYLDDESSLGLEGWIKEVTPPPPAEPLPTVETGIAHFLACLRGEAQPILTAKHARHVLDIVLKAYASMDDGRIHDTETTF
jgi:predicted dehydrogenase